MNHEQKVWVDHPYTRQKIMTYIRHYPQQVILAKFDDGDGMRQLGYLRHQPIDTPLTFRRKSIKGRFLCMCAWLFYLALSLAVVGICWYALFIHKLEEPVFQAMVMILGIMYTLTALKIQGWIRWMLLNFKKGL